MTSETQWKAAVENFKMWMDESFCCVNFMEHVIELCVSEIIQFPGEVMMPDHVYYSEFRLKFG